MRITNHHTGPLEFVEGVKDGEAVIKVVEPGKTETVNAKNDVNVEAYRNAGLITIEGAAAQRGKESPAS